MKKEKLSNQLRRKLPFQSNQVFACFEESEIVNMARAAEELESPELYVEETLYPNQKGSDPVKIIRFKKDDEIEVLASWETKDGLTDDHMVEHIGSVNGKPSIWYKRVAEPVGEFEPVSVGENDFYRHLKDKEEFSNSIFNYSVVLGGWMIYTKAERISTPVLFAEK